MLLHFLLVTKKHYPISLLMWYWLVGKISGLAFSDTQNLFSKLFSFGNDSSDEHEYQHHHHETKQTGTNVDSATWLWVLNSWLLVVLLTNRLVARLIRRWPTADRPVCLLIIRWFAHYPCTCVSINKAWHRCDDSGWECICSDVDDSGCGWLPAFPIYSAVLSALAPNV